MWSFLKSPNKEDGRVTTDPALVERLLTVVDYTGGLYFLCSQYLRIRFFITSADWLEVRSSHHRRAIEPSMRWLLLLSAVVVVNSQRNLVDASLKFCEAFVQCSAVALLEERLCLGNSLLRPYWLPDSHDKNNCHEKLRNDYMMLEKMEEQLDNLLLDCLVKHTVPFTNEQMDQCNTNALKSTPRFSYGRNINYVPTQCFTGVEKRRERECGRVRSCCPALSK
ncbi:unnamed protein product [Strongylus vulgaris]|uniref:Uncharacterized protein n=1 Tax=Strongylus vulgaris TaxID=40348 RepID=A0A3P7KXV2_STRVU|nr:unnamed protein product [Strongylus vulgaris]